MLNMTSLFCQGDILFLHMSKDPIRAGEIVVFNVDVSYLITFSAFKFNIS